MIMCLGSGSDGVNFPHSSTRSAVIYICRQNSVDNTPIFWLLLSSACTASMLSLQPCSFFQREGTQLRQLTQADKRHIPYHKISCSAIKDKTKKEMRGHSLLRCLSYKAADTHTEALLLRKWLDVTC